MLDFSSLNRIGSTWKSEDAVKFRNLEARPDTESVLLQTSISRSG